MLLVDIFEARDPKKTYHFKEVKGKVEQIILKLDGNESAAYTKMSKRYKEIDAELKKLQAERDAMNEKIKTDIVENYFDAEDAVMTRIIETVSLTAQIAKTPKPKAKVDTDAVLEKLLELMPELTEKVAALQKEFTSFPTPKAPALSVKTNESVSDVWAKVKAKLSKFFASISAWGTKYDAKLAEIKNMLKPARQVAEAELHVSNTTILAKKFIKNLNNAAKDESIEQDDVDGLVKDLDGTDGDILLNVKTISQLPTFKKSKNKEAILSAAGVKQVKEAADPEKAAAKAKAKFDQENLVASDGQTYSLFGKISVPNLNWAGPATGNPLKVVSKNREPRTDEDKAKAKEYLDGLDKLMKEFKDAVAKIENGTNMKAKEQTVVNGEKILKALHAFNNSVDKFNAISLRINKASAADDIEEFGKCSSELASLCRSVVDDSRVTKTKMAIPTFLSPGRTLAAIGYEYMFYCRDKAAKYHKRMGMSDAQRKASDKASARMRLAWME